MAEFVLFLFLSPAWRLAVADAAAGRLIATLADDNYHRREQAHRALARLRPFPFTKLAAAADWHPDPEVRARCLLLVRQHRAEFAPRAPRIELRRPETYPMGQSPEGE